MKFGQLIEYNNRKNFPQKSRGNEAQRLVPDHFYLKKKALCEVKTSYLQLSFNMFL